LGLVDLKTKFHDLGKVMAMEKIGGGDKSGDRINAHKYYHVSQIKVGDVLACISGTLALIKCPD